MLNQPQTQSFETHPQNKSTVQYFANLKKLHQLAKEIIIIYLFFIFFKMICCMREVLTRHIDFEKTYTSIAEHAAPERFWNCNIG